LNKLVALTTQWYMRFFTPHKVKLSESWNCDYGKGINVHAYQNQIEDTQKRQNAYNEKMRDNEIIYLITTAVKFTS
jgi:hypothetical protein